MAYYLQIVLAIENDNRLFKSWLFFKSRYGKHEEQKKFSA